MSDIKKFLGSTVVSILLITLAVVYFLGRVTGLAWLFGVLGSLVVIALIAYASWYIVKKPMNVATDRWLAFWAQVIFWFCVFCLFIKVALWIGYVAIGVGIAVLIFYIIRWIMQKKRKATP